MTQFSPDEYSAKTTILLNLDQALDKFGLDPVAELHKLGFKPADFNDIQLRMPVSRAAEVLLHCIQITHCEHFVLELVQLQTAAIDGYFGMLLRTAPTLRDAIRIAARELYLHQKGVAWSFHQEQRHAHFSLSWDAKLLAPNHRFVLAELGIAQGWLVMRNQCQRPIEVQSVQFVRNPPADKRPYRRFFNGSVQFNCDVDQLNFSASQLDTPMSHADPHLHEAVRELIRLSKTDAPRPTLVGEVQSVIRMLLPQGECSIERVCRYLMRDKRTLQRQLRDGFGLTFQDLLQEERLKLVQVYLVESAQSITQIAYATGYREPGNMARAFRRHFGCTPSQWRERHPLQSEAPGNVQDPCSE